MNAKSGLPDTAPAGAHAYAFENVSLVGFMASGKSAVGRALGNLLHWEFVDLDTELEEQEGAAVVEIFERHGEAAFRQMEASVLERSLAESGRVIATGGGAVLLEKSRHILRARSRVIWLRLSRSGILARLSRYGIEKRPLLRGADRAELSARIERLLAEREPLYRGVAHWELVVDGRRPTQVAAEIARALGERKRR